jgi:hypothetical protein
VEQLKSISKIWKKIAPNNSFDTRACKTLVALVEGGSGISTGKQCIEFILANTQKILDTLLPPMPSLEENQCDSTLQAECTERMLTCINACFKTDRGVILLENDMLLFQDVEREAQEEWYTETCERWKGLLHSALQEEFCSALRLWFVLNTTQYN